MNSFQVTRSKVIGAAVLLLDLLKGAGAVALASVLFGEQFSIQATSGISVVAGHNFPVWLRFKGGRGLATAAGVMLILSWVFVLIWLILWAIGFVLTKHVNVGNTIASASELVGILIVPVGVLSVPLSQAIAPVEFKWFALVLFSVILFKHIDPLREYLDKSKSHR